MHQTPYAQYRREQIITASTGELVVLLYDGALRYLALAEIALNERRLDLANDNLFKAQEVVLELYAGLDFEQGGDLAANLCDLYLYAYRTLVSANLRKDVEQVRHIAKLLTQLRDSWRTVVQGGASTDVTLGQAAPGQGGRVAASA